MQKQKKKQDEENAYIACEQHEVVFNCAEETSMKCVECYGKDNDISVATNTWIANSSASCHRIVVPAVI